MEKLENFFLINEEGYMEDRLTRTELNLGIARLISLRGTCERLRVGCVIVKDDRIISTGYNGPLPREEHCSPCACDKSVSCIRAVHAEANAIYHASRIGISLENATMYCTHSPCTDCVEAIIQAGIKAVYFIEKFREDGPIERLITNGCKAIQISFDEQGKQNSESTWQFGK